MPENDKTDTDNHPKSEKDQKGSQRGLWWIIVAGLFAVVAVIFVGSVWISPVDRTRFITEFILTVALADLVAVQAYIYKKQWTVMERQFMEFENQTRQNEWAFRQNQRNAAATQAQMQQQSDAMKGQLEAMKEQAVIMRETLAQNQKQIEHMTVIDRAYIEIADMRMGALKVDEMVIVKSVFLNVGRSPAWNFRFRSTLIFLEKPQPLNPEWFKNRAMRGKGKLLPAGEKLVDESPSNFIFTREQVQALFNKTAKLFLGGEIDYIDITGKIPPSSFLRLYDPETGEFKEHEQAENGEIK